MRTTVTLAEDVAAAVRQIREREGIGLSEAINRLARAGVLHKPPRSRYHMPTFDLGEFRVDISNTAEALELAEGPNHK